LETGPSFSHHLALGLVWIKVAIMLTTQPILNFDPRDYAIVVTDIYDSMHGRGVWSVAEGSRNIPWYEKYKYIHSKTFAFAEGDHAY
jgi:hypothetical protein